MLSDFMSHLFAPCMVKVGFIIEQDMKAQTGSRGTLYVTSVIDGGGWSVPCPGHFTRGKDIQGFALVLETGDNHLAVNSSDISLVRVLYLLMKVYAM